MGNFYGRISPLNRTAFTFDRIYDSRYTMEVSQQSDGIFINRFVLIDYGTPPIAGYYNETNDTFYHNLKTGDSNNIIPPVEGTIYQDLNNMMTTYSFYQYEGGHYRPYTANGISFCQSYNLDREHYGRGYHGTVWMKTAIGYNLIAELNTRIPVFRLIADPPTSDVVPPYFDGNTTDFDYYLHIPTSFSHRINKIADEEKQSDENVIERIGHFENNGKFWTYEDSTIKGDIYYNKAGFSKYENHYDRSMEGQDSINYTLASSGKLYFGENNGALEEQGVASPDTYLWHIHLPSIGNTIAELWNIAYTPLRYTQLLKEDFTNYGENDESAIFCTVDTDSILGVTNTARCYLGRVYELKDTAFIKSGEIYLSKNTINTLTYTKKIMYIDTVSEDDEMTRTYYYPSYRNEWIVNENGNYYFDIATSTYKKANKTILPPGTQYYTRQTTNNGQPLLQFSKMYSVIKPAGKYSTGLDAIAADEIDGPATTVLGSLALMNRLIGTGLSVADSRDDRTLIGLMNCVKDLIANIDTQLAPNSLLATDANGIIKTTTTSFPYNDDSASDTDKSKYLLNGEGKWQQLGDVKLTNLNVSTEKMIRLGITNENTLAEIITQLINYVVKED